MSVPVEERTDDDIIDWFDRIAENPAEEQSRTLRKILERNLNTEYLRKYLNLQDLDSDNLGKLYASSVPLVSHADIESYIRRIADGDDSPVLTGEPITMLSLSSGTTEGRQKYVPFTRFSAQSTLLITRLSSAFRAHAFPIRPNKKTLDLIYSSKKSVTAGGLAVGTATTHYFSSDEFRKKQSLTKSFSCSSADVIAGGDYKKVTYNHLLLGLFQSEEVEVISSTFAYSLVQAFTMLEDLWVRIVADIKFGESEHIAIPNPKLAAEIEAKCLDLKKRDWEGMISELWPNAKYVYSIMTGSMQPYVKKLRHYARDVALVCADYGSTESWIGANLDALDPPEKVAFTVVPTFAYFEFVPVSRRQGVEVEVDDFEEGMPVPLEKVRLGEWYEVVLTTFTGLYRYRLGDIVEVSGFYNKIPKLTFICRRKLILTINIDKNTENDLQLVVEKAANLLSQKSKSELVDFTSHANLIDHPGRYVIYWELKGTVGDEVVQDCCNEMDAAFADHGYVVSRRSGSIGKLELRIVEKGTFGRVLEYFIGNGAAMSQFKTPRCTRDRTLLRILDDSMVKRFWSRAYG